MQRSWMFCTSLALVAALHTASPVLAQDSKSAGPAKALAEAMAAKKIDAVAARHPDAADVFVAALTFPGQIILISAKYAAPPLLNEKLAQNNHRDVYVELNSASVPDSRFIVTDLGADGLKAKKANKNDLAVDSRDLGGATIRFDGNWREDKMSEADYMKAFSEADERYATLLGLLVEAAQK